MNELWYKVRRVISVMLVVALSVTTAPVGAFADDDMAAAAQIPTGVSDSAEPAGEPEALNNEEVPPADSTPVVETPAEEPPVAETPAEETPAGSTPTVETPAESTPAVETPAVETPEGETPVVEAPEEEVPAVETPEGETPVVEAPEEEVPAGETPAGETPEEETPAGETPEGETPEEETPAESTPTEEEPEEAEPVQQQLTGAAEDGTTYTVDGVLPEGASVQVAPMEDLTQLETLIGEQLQEGQALNALVVNDVTIVDAEGNAVQPEAPVTVTMALPEVGENQSAVLFHQKADGTLETAEAGVGVLEVSSFSPIGYYVVETLNLASRASYGLEYRDLEVGGSFQIWGGEGRNHSWNISGGEGIVYLRGYSSSATVTALSEGTATITVTHQYKKGGFLGMGGTTVTDTYQYVVTVSAAKVTLTYDANYGNGGQGAAPEAVKGEAGDTVVLPGMSGEGFLGWSTVATANNGGSENYTKTVYPAGYSYTLPEASVTLYAIWVQDYGADAIFYIRLDGTIPDEPSGYDTKEYTGGITLSGAIKQGKFVSDTTGAAVLSNLNKTPSDSQIQQVMQAAGKTYDPSTQYILWYVIKEEGEGWHVDGVVLNQSMYNVRYHPNALVGQYTGDVPLGRQYVKDATVTVEGQGTLQRSGYQFLGWSEDPNATSAQYTAGNTFKMPNRDVDLYAVWRNLQSYDLTVELYAGNPSGSSTLINSKQVSVGWNQLKEYKNYSSAELANAMWGYTFTSEGDLYTAQWTPSSLKEDTYSYVVRIYVREESPDLVTVSYDANGGTGDVPARAILVKGDAYSPVAGGEGLSKTNSDFTGWNTLADGTGTPYAPGGTISAVNEDTVLHAQWQVNVFNITYAADANGSVSPTSETVNAGEDAVGSKATPATGYQFTNWTNEAGVVVSESATFAPQDVLADATYTAHFAPKDYQVVYSWTGAPDSETLPENQTVKFNASYTIDSTYTSETVVYTYDAYNNINGKYTFSGWTDPNKGVMTTEGVTVTGTWTFEEVAVAKHDVNYSWTGAPESETLPESIIGLVKGQPYTVDSTYTSETIVYTYDAYNNINGQYTFSGWTDPGDGVMDESDVTVTGTWTFTEVAVAKYDVNYSWDGDVPETETLPESITGLVKGQPYTVDSTYTDATVVETTDAYGNVTGRYTFSGWTDPNNGVMDESDVTVSGTWTFEEVAVAKYDVNYSWNGDVPETATLPESIIGLVKGQPYTVDSTYTSESIVYTYDAYNNINGQYTFSGWTDPGDGVMDESNVTVSGTWTFEEVAVAKYDVNYSWDGDVPETATLPESITGLAKNQPYEIDTTYTSATIVYTYDAYNNINGQYTFSGWTDPNDGLMGESNVTVTGTWTFEEVAVAKYDVNYSWDGDVPETATLPESITGLAKNQPYEIDTTYTSATIVYTYDAYNNINGQYTFSGWTDPNDGLMGESNVTVTGTWTFEEVAVAKYDVNYSWDGDVPETATLPESITGLAKNQPYEIDTTYTSATIVYTYDAYNNINGQYTFSGWTDPGDGLMGESNVTVTGTWTFEEVAVAKYDVNYSWDGDVPETATLPESITGLAKNQPYEIDTTYTSATIVYTYDAYNNINGQYTFSGWTDPNDGLMGESNVTVTGTWTFTEVKVAEYTITYMLDGAFYASETKVYNQPISLMANPEDREGYTFSGWTVEEYPDGLPATMPAESLVVVGSFTVNNYDYTVNHIYLNREGVEVDRDPESGNAAYGTTITYSQRLVYQDQTYLFNSDDGPKTIGIDPAQNVLNVYYDIDVLVDPGKDPDGDPDNGDQIPDKFQVVVNYEAANGTPAIGSELLTLTDENGNYSETGTAQASMPEVTAAEGYTWYDKNWYTDDTYITVANATVTADTTFYAYCDEDDNGDNIPEKFQVTVTYVAENGTPAIGSELLNLVDENGVYSETGTAQASMPEVTAAEGYTWYDKNWYADNAYTTVANATVTADTTFYAYCDEDSNGDDIPNKFQVTVTYVVANGTPAIGSELLNLVDENGVYSETGTAQASMPEVTAAEGYTWYDKNWYADNAYTTVANATVTADTTFYAYCDEDDNGDNIPEKFQVTVTYVAENGTPAIGSELLNLVDENGVYSETGTAQATMPDVTAAEGYTWYDKNWYTDDTYITVANATVTADTTFYAYCDEDDNGDNIPEKFQVTVTYVAENGTPAIGSELLNLVDENGVYSETGTAQASMPEVTAAEGYTWYDTNWYTDDTYTTVANATVTADATFYAYCDEDDNGDNIPEKFQVTVTYVAENGTPAIGSELLNLVDENGVYSETGTAQASMPEVTAAEGYTWYDKNWYTDDTYSTVANATVTADTTFYAYCDTDVLVDPGKDPDGNPDNGDGIPDSKQVIVTFEAINGVVRPKGGTDADNAKSISTVVTLLDENGMPAANGTGYLTDAQIPEALSNMGYDGDSAVWTPETPTTTYGITKTMTFVVDFSANGTPVTPPDEGGETPTTPTTPTTPVTPGTEEPEEPAEETPAEEELEDEEAPLASGEEGEEIADEEAPLAAPAGAAWALLNLILAILTALGSVLLLIGYIGKKKKEEENENGENVEYTVKKKGVWRVLSLIPGIGAIVAFILTENMRNPMVFTDRWTLLMVIIAVIQVIVAILAKKEKEEPDDREAQA